MPNPTWPLSLPQSLLLNYSETALPNTIATEMDAGPPKVRKRYQSQIRRFSGALYMTVDQKKTFRDFHEETVSEFDWKDPTDNTPAECRFIQPMPTYQRIAPHLFLVTFAFEILP